MGRSLSYWYVKDKTISNGKELKMIIFQINIKRFWRKIQIGNFLNYNDCNYCDVLGNYSYLGWIKNILLTLIKEASEELKMKVEMNINI